jgi:hypothetical protein
MRDQGQARKFGLPWNLSEGPWKNY